MDLKNFNNKLKHQFDYTLEYIHNVFFKLLLLFIINFVVFGLYFKGFFKSNLIIFLVFLIGDLFLIKKLLYKKARISKIIVIIAIIILSFFVAQYYSNAFFENFGFNSFISNFGEGLSDKLVLSGTKDMLKDTVKSGKDIIKETSNSVIHSKEDSQKTFDYINQLRQENGLKEILWDDKIYELAKWKAEDMTRREYFDHIDPDKKCVGSYAKNYGLMYSSNSFAENIFGYSSPTWFDQKEAVESWMDSRGHRYNLLFEGHIRGAIACDSKNCVFIGQGGSGWICDTGEAGLVFWNSVGKQPGEN